MSDADAGDDPTTGYSVAHFRMQELDVSRGNVPSPAKRIQRANGVSCGWEDNGAEDCASKI